MLHYALLVSLMRFRKKRISATRFPVDALKTPIILETEVINVLGLPFAEQIAIRVEIMVQRILLQVKQLCSELSVQGAPSAERSTPTIAVLVQVLLLQMNQNHTSRYVQGVPFAANTEVIFAKGLVYTNQYPQSVRTVRHAGVEISANVTEPTRQLAQSWHQLRLRGQQGRTHRAQLQSMWGPRLTSLMIHHPLRPLIGQLIQIMRMIRSAEQL